jgi:hypothetical protein
MSNLKLWQSVEKTDLSFTRQVNQRGGYTAISPQYQLMKATEQFGPYGAGFGLSASDFDFNLVESTNIVIHKATFFYVIEGKRHEFPISNAIEFARVTKDGKKIVDVDFAKKVETNTVSKALSKLGFNADVFLGMMEDNSYLSELQSELAIQKADDKDAELVKQRLEHEEWRTKELATYPSIKTASALKNIYTQHVRACQRRNDNEGMLMFKSAHDKQLQELSNEAV